MEPDDHQELNLCRIIIEEDIVKTQQEIHTLGAVILGEVYYSNLTL